MDIEKCRKIKEIAGKLEALLNICMFEESEDRKFRYFAYHVNGEVIHIPYELFPDFIEVIKHHIEKFQKELSNI